jgi:hypothetical protein
LLERLEHWLKSECVCSCMPPPCSCMLCLHSLSFIHYLF